MEREIEFRGNRFKIWCLESYATHPTWYTFEDEKEVREAWWNVQPGDNVLDVGACCGSYTLTALACGAKHVAALAPGKLQEGLREFEILQKSVALNGWEDRCDVHNWGLYEQLGTLNTDTLEFGRWGVHGLPEPRIKVLTLDHCNFEGLDWIKIDVEGVELEVLRGGRETILKSRPKVLVEHHLFRRRTLLEEVGQFFSELGGYELAGTIPHPASDVVHGLYVPVKR